MNDTLQVVKSLANDSVPYVNTGVFLGMSVADWDLALKVVLGLVSIGWTVLKIVNEYRTLRNRSNPN
jgi:hypothetical protein